MSDFGWVYIITNRSMPNLVKVGFTTKEPELRAKELKHTGSPHPYKVVFDIYTAHPRAVEKKAHRLLLTKREGKEWFRCSISTTIEALRSATSGLEIQENVRGQAIEQNHSPFPPGHALHEWY